MSTQLASFLTRPGRPGIFGAVLDETARAADHLCQTVEAIDGAHYLAERPSDHPDLISIRGVSLHCVNWAFAYSNFIRTVRGVGADGREKLPPTALSDPADVRGAIRDALTHTEVSLEGLWDATPPSIWALSFQVPWGVTYNPELILEHGIVHLLRHRRQIEKWS